jgi:putative transposase
MKKTRFTETQILRALKEYEAGKSVSDISRELSIHKQTFYSWLKKYQGMEKEDLVRLKELEQKYAKLQKMYADLAMDHNVLKDVLGKKF